MTTGKEFPSATDEDAALARTALDRALFRLTKAAMLHTPGLPDDDPLVRAVTDARVLLSLLHHAVDRDRLRQVARRLHENPPEASVTKEEFLERYKDR